MFFMKSHSFGDFIKDIVHEVKNDVDLLNSNACKNKYEVLKQLKDRVAVLENAVAVISKDYDLQVQAVPKNRKEVIQVQETPASPQSPPAPPPNTGELRVFTPEELSQCTGKGGKPGLVAVNGLIYDVSESPAFAAGTHFGLSCGKDLTNEFNQCHVGSDKLEKLKLVGKLA